MSGTNRYIVHLQGRRPPTLVGGDGGEIVTRMDGDIYNHHKRDKAVLSSVEFPSSTAHQSGPRFVDCA